MIILAELKQAQNFLEMSKIGKNGWVKSTEDVQITSDSIVRSGNEDVICMTDMLKAKDVEFFISDRLCDRNTGESPAIRGSVYNPEFNYGEFAIIKTKAGLNISKISRNDSHPDIFFKLDMWFWPEFKPVDFERFTTGTEGQA